VKQAFKKLTGTDFENRIKMGLGGPVEQWLAIPEVSLRLRQLQQSTFARNLSEIFGSKNIQIL
jgi:hypothetical protein